jgi:hypothetical protein
MKKLILVSFLALFTNIANAAGPIGSAIAPPQYVGYVITKGDLGWVSKSYKNTYKIAMPFAAHDVCNAQFSGSRAAEYEDFKYIYSNLPGGKYFVMNPFTARTDTGAYTYLAKTGQQFILTDAQSNLFCQNYTSTSSSYKTIVLDTATNNLKTYTCDLDLRIACVKD